MEEQRRRVPREPAGWPGSYRFDTDDGAAGECRVIDISIIGAGVEVHGTLPDRVVGRRVVVEAQAPSGGSISLRITGECRYVSPGGAGGTRVGIEFTDLTETERSILAVLGKMQVVW